MKENINNNIEKLTGKLMKDSYLESPSKDFTSNIMAQVEALADNETLIYKPLISRRIWIAVVVITFATIAYFLFNGSNEGGLLSSYNFDLLNGNKFSSTLSGFIFSKTLAYAIGIFSLMLAIQVPLLKGYLNKQVNL